MFQALKLFLCRLMGVAVTIATSFSAAPAWATVSRHDPYDNMWIQSSIVGAIVGYLAYRAFSNVSSAGPVRFTLVGVVGGWGGAFLGVLLVDDAFRTPGKVFALTVIGAIIGAAALSYVLRILHPAAKNGK